MRLRYETGTATLIHFIVMMLFAFVNTIMDIIDKCKDSPPSSCLQDSGISLIYVLLLAGWFGFLCVLGYAAQQNRNPKIAFTLMGAEAMVLLIALFNVQHYNGEANTPLEFLNSIVDAAFAAWIILLAFRLTRARGGRITAKGRARKRPSLVS